MGCRFLLFLLCALAAGRVRAEWPGVPYAEVRAYAWPLKNAAPAVLGPDFKLAKGVLNPKGAPLTPPQIARLLTAQKRRFTPRPLAGCYVPHNAFVFYDAQKKPVAFLEVCFDCLGARTSPADRDCDPDFLALGALCSELKLPFGRFGSLEEFRAATAPLLKSEP